jgi:hypothetical protein
MKLEDIKDKKILTSTELDILYSYLDSNIIDMSLDEIELWKEILKNLDPNYEE